MAKRTYVIDDELLRRASEDTGIKDHKELVEAGLKALIGFAEKLSSAERELILHRKRNMLK